MSTAIVGPRKWSLVRDDMGHREYKLTQRVQSNTPLDGPGRALLTPGLPVPGSFWIIDNEVDLWAWCRWNVNVVPVVDNEPNKQWDLEFTFSTKPWGKRCQETQIEDPLLVPQEVSGNFIKYQEEGGYDRFGNAIRNSAHELIRGPQNEWDCTRYSIKIKQNVPDLQLGLCCAMRDCVNQAPLWGLKQRFIKLTDFSWERKFWGTCFVYYERNFTFEAFIRLLQDPNDPFVIANGGNAIQVSGWDRELLDEGTKVLNGHWDNATGNWVLDKINGQPPDPKNPAHFRRFQDPQGNYCRVTLDGAGKPAFVYTANSLTTLVAATVLTNGGPTNLTLAAVFLPRPSQVMIQITDASRSIQSGQVVVIGHDKHGNAISDFVQIYNNGTAKYFTKKVFFDVAPDPGAAFGLQTSTTLIVGADGVATITLTDTTQVSTGSKLHVEKYDEADFLQLGIPIAF